MKTNIILITALLLFSGRAFAQDLRENEVPANVLKAFQGMFSTASDIEWERNIDYYKVDFDVNRNDHEVWYNANGEMLKHEEEIKNKDLPRAILDTIEREFDSLQIDDAEKITEAGTITYKVDLENYNEEWKVIFNENGKVIEKRRD